MSAAPDAPILLVEDNPDDEALTLRAFKRSNVVNDVEVVRDGQEALDYLFGNGEPAKRTPAMILLDLKLPKVDGLEVLKQVRAHPVTKLIPVVILTSSHEELDLIDTYGHGANSYVRKPVDFTQFAESVRQLGLYWLVVNEAPPAPSA
jgi:two-component system, response regulator